MTEFIKGVSITLVLVIVSRLGGRKTDGYLISLYGVSVSLTYLISSIVNWWYSVQNWWNSSAFMNFINGFKDVWTYIFG